MAADGLGTARHLTVAPNGDVYVAESHTDVRDPKLIGRISVFDKHGKFLRTIGKTGTGPGEFRTPHALATMEELSQFATDADSSIPFTDDERDNQPANDQAREADS